MKGKIIEKQPDEFNVLVQALSQIQLENITLKHKISSLSEKIEFYLQLKTENDFDKGFNKAFEIMKNLLTGEENNGMFNR